ncbi:tc5 transposase dna-binding domain [Holotrichia oblita]|uniref:Tc5 transposase dna-binding domain n=1 Tax=Holotrichia oblita TaxID=644536 RepID=A0ACB9TJ96_HOLOL|nr:tc5 transposase dna-binding domain [Holotrichia oblita]
MRNWSNKFGRLNENLRLDVIILKATFIGLTTLSVWLYDMSLLLKFQYKKGCVQRSQIFTNLASALNAIKNAVLKKQAAKLYGVPRATIQFRLSNKFTKASPGPPPILTASEEDTLVKWILESQKKGFPRRKDDIQATVKAFLDHHERKTPFNNNLPGNHWYEAFLKRHSELAERTAEAVTQSSACVSAQDLKTWFYDIKVYLISKGYDSILDEPRRILEMRPVFC